MAVPLFGAYGRALSGQKAEIDERIELSSGAKKIEVTCVTEKGAEAFRAFAKAQYTEKVRGDLYLLGFGVSRYRAPALTLKYATKDTEDLAARLQRGLLLCSAACDRCGGRSATGRRVDLRSVCPSCCCIRALAAAIAGGLIARHSLRATVQQWHRGLALY